MLTVPPSPAALCFALTGSVLLTCLVPAGLLGLRYYYSRKVVLAYLDCALHTDMADIERYYMKPPGESPAPPSHRAHDPGGTCGGWRALAQSWGCHGLAGAGHRARTPSVHRALPSTPLRSCPLRLLRGEGLCHLSLVLPGPGRSLVPTWIRGWWKGVQRTPLLGEGLRKQGTLQEQGLKSWSLSVLSGPLSEPVGLTPGSW